MSQKAEAICHGAATIVNAIAYGKGAAFGVDLWTKAEVELTNNPGLIEGEITSDPTESKVLIEKTVQRVFRYFGVTKKFGAKVRTQSNIPIAKGLKSSSAAANSITLASVAVLGKKLDPLEIINISVDAAFEAKVTVTGAFDDACASYFGGIVVSDNSKRQMIKHTSMPEDLAILFHVPSKKAYTCDSDVKRLRSAKPLVKIAYEEALKGNYWASLTLNGLIYSSAIGYNTVVAMDALEAGALAAGLCGKGPTVTAVVPPGKVSSVKAALRNYEGQILKTRVNHEQAKVVEI